MYNDFFNVRRSRIESDRAIVCANPKNTFVIVQHSAYDKWVIQRKVAAQPILYKLVGVHVVPLYDVGVRCYPQVAVAIHT